MNARDALGCSVGFNDTLAVPTERLPRAGDSGAHRIRLPELPDALEAIPYSRLKIERKSCVARRDAGGLEENSLCYKPTDDAVADVEMLCRGVVSKVAGANRLLRR